MHERCLSSIIAGCKNLSHFQQLLAHLTVTLHYHHHHSPPISAFNSLLRYLHPSPHLHPLSLYSFLLSSSPLRPDHLTFPFLFKLSSSYSLTASQSLHAHVILLGLSPDIYISNSILSTYLRRGDFHNAIHLFSSMEEYRNVVTWNSVITGFVQGGRSKDALDFFHQMLLLADDGRVRPDKVTVATVISACSHLGSLDQGRWVHGYARRCELEFDVVIGTALVDMYAKCGCLDRAVEVFNGMLKRDVLAWTAMIAAFASHGLCNEAFRVLEAMEGHGVRPNYVTFGALLCACAHSGLVDTGRWCFNRMQEVYFIKPQLQHYASMVDLLGRAALFEEAEELIRSMPMEPDSYVWGALLGACRMHGNVEVGERVASHLISLDPLNHAFYIGLSDIYAKANRYGDVKKVRTLMEEHGIKKNAPGSSTIEVDGQVLEFSAKRMPKELKVEIEFILKVVNDELKASMLLSYDYYINSSY